MLEIDDPVGLTRWLVRQHTCTGEPNEGFLALFTDWLAARRFSIVTVETAGIRHLAATVGPEDARLRIGFVGHYDTVPVGGGWTRPPHGAVEEQGILYGRGASDMKSGVAAMIFAALRLADAGVRATVFLPGDEETTSLGMPALLAARPWNLDACICGEPTSKSAFGDCVKIGRRGVLQGVLHLLGRPGHAAYAERTPNVVNSIPAVLAALSDGWNDVAHGTETTVTVTNITTDSPATNVIPGVVSLTIDARFAPRRNLDEVKTELARRLAATGVPHRFEVTKESAPYLTDMAGDAWSPQRRLVGAATAAIEALLGITPALTCDGGFSDARFVAWQGVPTIEFGVPHGGMHGPDEFVAVDHIRRLVDVYAATAERLLADRAPAP